MESDDRKSSRWTGSNLLTSPDHFSRPYAGPPVILDITESKMGDAPPIATITPTGSPGLAASAKGRLLGYRFLQPILCFLF